MNTGEALKIGESYSPGDVNLFPMLERDADGRYWQVVSGTTYGSEVRTELNPRQAMAWMIAATQ